MESVTLINGNKKPYTTEMPRIIIQVEMTDAAIAHIYENTAIDFKITPWSTNAYEAQPENGTQIAALFMTYNFKTRYYNNWNYKNTIMLRNDHHIGFDVSSICYNCCKHNGIVTTSLKPHERLAC